MFDRFAGALLGGARGGYRASSHGARAKEGIVTRGCDPIGERDGEPVFRAEPWLRVGTLRELQGGPRFRRRADAGVLRVLEPAAGGDAWRQRAAGRPRGRRGEGRRGLEARQAHKRLRASGREARPSWERAARGPDARPDLLQDNERGPRDPALAYHRRTHRRAYIQRQGGCRGAARDLLRHHGIRFRARPRPRGEVLAARVSRVGPLQQGYGGREREAPPAEAHKGRRLREVPPQDVPRPEALLCRR